MKKPLLSRLLAWAIIIQMVSSPVAFAANYGNQQYGQPNEAGMIYQAGQQAINMANQAQQQRIEGMAKQNQYNMITALMDPYNCGTPQQRVTCTSPLLGCPILNAYPSTAMPAECKKSNTILDANYANAYAAHYRQMIKEYQLNLISSENSTGKGVSCLENEADKLAKLLQQRIVDMDKMINDLNIAHSKFKEEAERTDLAAIKQATALLNGGNGKIAKAEMDKNSTVFSEFFSGNPACASVMNSDEFKAKGAGGFKGIEASLDSIANKKADDKPGSFNAREYTSGTSDAIRSEVDRLAGYLAREIQINGDDFLNGQGMKKYNSSFGLTESGAFSSAVAEEANKAELDKNEILSKAKAFGGSISSLTNELNNERMDFEFELEQWKNRETNACLARNENIQRILTDKIEISDPNASDTAKKYADNPYKTFIKSVLAQQDIGIEEKLALIQAEEAKDRNTRFIVKATKGARNESTTTKQADSSTAANFIAMIVNNCNSQFKSNKRFNGKTGAQVVEGMKSIRTEMMGYRKTLANKVKNELVRKLTSCSNNLQANAVGVATCSSKDLSTSSPTFCINRANACATNMRSCADKAKAKVEEVTKKRDAALTQYNRNMDAHENTLKNLYLMAQNLTNMDALAINANLKQPMSLPTDIEMNIDQDKRKFLAELETIEVRDPDQYFNMMKKNIERLKGKIIAQNDAVMNGSSEAAGVNAEAKKGVNGHIAEIKKNMSKVIGDLEGLAAACDNAFNGYNEMAQQMNQEIERTNREQQKAYNEYCYDPRHEVQPLCGEPEAFYEMAETAAKMADKERAYYYRSKGRSCETDMNSESGYISENGFRKLINQEGDKEFKGLNEYCEKKSEDGPGSAPCEDWIEYSKICVDLDVKELRRVTKKIPENCINPSKDDEIKCQPLIETALKSQDCGNNPKDHREKKFQIMTDIADEIRSTMGESMDETADLGENRSMVCAVPDNTNVAYKAFQDAMNQMGGGMGTMTTGR